MPTKSPCPTPFDELREDPQFFMFKGITREENHRLQAKAQTVVRQLFRRRFKNPDKLLSDFRAALRHQGFIRIKLLPLVPSNGGIQFEAVLGSKLKKRLRNLKYSRSEDVLYGVVTRAARRCDLDPRIEDICASVQGNRVVGMANAVPFIHQSRAIDRALGLPPVD